MGRSSTSTSVSSGRCGTSILGGGPRCGRLSREEGLKLGAGIGPGPEAFEERDSVGSGGKSRAPPDCLRVLFQSGRSRGGNKVSLSTGVVGNVEFERGVEERGGNTKVGCFAVSMSSGGVGAVGLRGLPLALRGVCGVSRGGAPRNGGGEGSMVGKRKVLMGGCSRSSPNIIARVAGILAGGGRTVALEVASSLVEVDKEREFSRRGRGSPKGDPRTVSNSHAPS